jgi:DNA-binding NarL/FixJ family response regulator
VTTNQHKPIHVLIIDDSDAIRKMLRRVLAAHADIHLSADIGDPYSALERIRHGFEGVVVIDINLPELDGIQVIREIKRIRRELPIVVLSFQSDIRYVQESFRAGAAGFVLKERAYEDLPAAIRNVTGNSGYISIDLVP